MNDPIPISKNDPDTDVEKARYQQRVGWAMFSLVAVVVIGLLIPLVVWLTRLALGG